jgi:phospholipase/lecithinase/hemolysin
VDSYLLSHQEVADPDSLFIIWIGSNNYLSVPDEPEQEVALVIGNIKLNAERLVSRGAKHLLFVNLPDLGKAPFARELDAVQPLTYIASRHNTAMDDLISHMQNKYPNVQWLRFDVNTLFNEMLQGTAPEYVFTNTDGVCYEDMMQVQDQKSKRPMLEMAASVRPHGLKQDACTGFLFFDPMHPSFAAHQIMAKRMKTLLDVSMISFSKS